MRSIGKELAKQAKKHGICEGWYRELLETRDTGKLIDMYLRGIDFCLSNEFPSNDFIKANFAGEAEAHGIFVDREMLALRNPRLIVALGTSSGNILLEDYNACELYIKHKSVIELHIMGNGWAMVDLFDNSRLIIHASGNAKAFVNRYGGEVTYKAQENSAVKIREKNKKTY